METNLKFQRVLDGETTMRSFKGRIELEQEDRDEGSTFRDSGITVHVRE